MRRSRKLFAREVEADRITCFRCDGKGYDRYGSCYVCNFEGHQTLAQWESSKADLRRTFADNGDLAERVILRHEGGRVRRETKRMPAELKAWAREQLTEDIERAYRHYYEMLARVGAYGAGYVHEPNVTVTTATDWLAQYLNSPCDFYLEPRRRQISWVRSLLGTMAKAGELGTSYGVGRQGKETRVYEPTDERRDELKAAANLNR